MFDRQRHWFCRALDAARWSTRSVNWRAANLRCSMQPERFSIRRPEQLLMSLTGWIFACTYNTVNNHLAANAFRRLLPTLLLVVAMHGIAAEAPVLQAGVARVNLTPPLEMKAALGGYGARQSKPALGVHDSVWAAALVLASGDRKFVLVTADVLAFPPQFKAAVMQGLSSEGWGADQVMLLPSHTHTSIDMMALHPGNVFGNRQLGSSTRNCSSTPSNNWPK